MQNNFKSFNKKLWQEIVREKAVRNNSFNLEIFIIAKRAAAHFIESDTLPTKENKTMFNNMVG